MPGVAPLLGALFKGWIQTSEVIDLLTVVAPDRIIGERLGAADIARAVEIIGSFIDQHRRRLFLYHRR
jgi:signal recognition particle GTPase